MAERLDAVRVVGPDVREDRCGVVSVDSLGEVREGRLEVRGVKSRGHLHDQYVAVDVDAVAGHSLRL